MRSGINRIFLAEDDIDDREIFGEAFRELSSPRLTLHSFEDGLDLIEHLNRQQSEDELPRLIVLDQNMPRMTGKDTLLYLKSNEAYTNIPVVIYSTYHDQFLIKEFEHLGAALTIAKPDSFPAFKKMVQMFVNDFVFQQPAAQV